MAAIRFSSLSFTYASESEPALQEASLEIQPGELVVFGGPSGCGKTTLLRCLNGLVPRFYEGTFSGEVQIDGTSIADLELHDIGMKVGSVFQDPRSQFFTTRPEAEIAFGCENIGMAPAEIRQRIDDVLKGLRGERLRDKSVFQLSSGQRQKVAVGAARAMDLSIYALDEPSANLDLQAAEQLAEILRQLKAEGKTIVLAEHRLHYLMPILDRLFYMNEGRVEAEYSAAELRAMKPRRLRKMGLRQPELNRLEPAPRERIRPAGVALRSSHLRFGYERGKNSRDVLKEARLIAHPGEIIGMVGANGAGKTTFARVLSGLEDPSDGYVFLDGKPLSAKERIANTCLVLQDADYQLYRESVAEELKLGFQGAETSPERVRKIAAKLGLETCLERHPQSLSGGQKQRLTIGMAEVKQCPVVILDEPTSGLDAENMRRVGKVVKGLAASGRICLMISHDFEFLLEVCTRIVALESGSILRDFPLERGRSMELLALMRGAGMRDLQTHRHIRSHTRFRVDREGHADWGGRRRRPMRFDDADPVYVRMGKR